MPKLSAKNMSLGLASQDLGLGDQLRAQTDALLAQRAQNTPAENISDANSGQLISGFGNFGPAALELLTPKRIMR